VREIRSLGSVRGGTREGGLYRDTPLNLASLGVHAGEAATPLLRDQPSEPGAQLMQVVMARRTTRGSPATPKDTGVSATRLLRLLPLAPDVYEEGFGGWTPRGAR